MPTTNTAPDDTQTQPMQVNPSMMQPASADPAELEEVAHGGTADLEAHRAATPHMNPMLHAEEPSPQGPPPTGKEQFHNTMADFGHRAEANRAEVMGLDPSDPDYIKKLGALQAQHGAITTEKARYQMLHPWGGPESAHPGILGKIGHVAGEIGNTLGGNALQVPGSQGALQAAEHSGAAETEAGIGDQQKAATVADTEAQVPERKANTAHLEQETTDAKNKPATPESMQQEYTDAVTDAQNRGVDPATDPKVAQLQDAITNVQKQPGNAQEKLDQQYQDALQSGDHEKAERILKVKSDLARAGQAPQRPPQTMVVLPGGQTEVARPGMTLPEGTQNIGGFATEGRPTTQMRNVNAQAQVAAQGIPDVVSEIGRLKDQLGPVSGRWNEFMQGKVGMENPDMAGLRADLLMVSSAVALAHARGRLPENLRAEFDAMINAPQQSPENLVAVLNHIKPWMERMGKMGAQAQDGGGAQPQRPSNVPEGFQFNAHGPKGAGWYKPTAAAQ